MINQSRTQQRKAENQPKYFNLTSIHINNSKQFNQLQSKYNLLEFENSKLEENAQKFEKTIRSLKLQIKKFGIINENSNSSDSQFRVDQDINFDLEPSNQQSCQILIPKKIHANSQFKKHHSKNYLKPNGHATTHYNFESANFKNLDDSKEYIQKLNQFSNVRATEYINVEMSKKQKHENQNQIRLTLKFASDPNNNFLKMFRKMLQLKPLSQHLQDPSSTFYRSEIHNYPNQHAGKSGNNGFGEGVQPVPSPSGYSHNARSRHRYPKKLEGIKERTIEFSPDPEKDYGHDEFERSEPKQLILLSTLNNSKGQQHAIHKNGNFSRELSGQNHQTATRGRKHHFNEGNSTDSQTYSNYIESNNYDPESHIQKKVADNEEIGPRNNRKQNQRKSPDNYSKRLQYNYSPDSPNPKQTFNQERSLNNSRDFQHHKISRFSHAVGGNNNTFPQMNLGSSSTIKITQWSYLYPRTQLTKSKIRINRLIQKMKNPDYYNQIFKEKKCWASNSSSISKIKVCLTLNERNEYLPKLMLNSLAECINSQYVKIKNLRKKNKKQMEEIDDHKRTNTTLSDDIKTLRSNRF